MQIRLTDFLWESWLIYLDDFIVLGSPFEEEILARVCSQLGKSVVKLGLRSSVYHK